VVLGPPGSGKTAVSTALGQHLYLPVVRVGDAVNLALGRAAPGVVDSIGPVRWPEGLRERVGETMVAPTSRLPTKLLARVVHTVLTTPKLRNRGYVLDGFPRTFAEAFSLFALRDDAGDLDAPDPESFVDVPIGADPAVIPGSVIILDGPDAVLEARVMGLPESAVVGTHNDPISFRRRLTRYRAVNVLDGPENPVGFFEEGIKLEVLEVALGVDADLPATVSDVLVPYIERKGGVYNYHPTEEEVAAEEARVKSAEEAAAKAAYDSACSIVGREVEERQRRNTEVASKLSELSAKDAALLEAKSKDLRAYLMDHVVPTLAAGLKDVKAAKPADYVDHLAAFLFSKSPHDGE